MIEKNKYFKKFVVEHQKNLDKQIEKVFGPNSHYQRNMYKSGQTVPFKTRFNKFVHNNNVFRKENPKLFAKLQGEDYSQQVRTMKGLAQFLGK